jgi:hypothetical protein
MIDYPCKWCNSVFLDSDELEDHAKEVHNKVPVYPCKKCNEVIRGTMNFDKHLTLVHGTTHWDLHLAIRELKRTFRKVIE